MTVMSHFRVTTYCTDLVEMVDEMDRVVRGYLPYTPHPRPPGGVELERPACVELGSHRAAQASQAERLRVSCLGMA